MSEATEHNFEYGVWTLHHETVLLALTIYAYANFYLLWLADALHVLFPLTFAWLSIFLAVYYKYWRVLLVTLISFLLFLIDLDNIGAMTPDSVPTS